MPHHVVAEGAKGREIKMWAVFKSRVVWCLLTDDGLQLPSYLATGYAAWGHGSGNPSSSFEGGKIGEG